MFAIKGNDTVTPSVMWVQATLTYTYADFHMECCVCAYQAAMVDTNHPQPQVGLQTTSSGLAVAVWLIKKKSLHCGGPQLSVARATFTPRYVLVSPAASYLTMTSWSIQPCSRFGECFSKEAR